MESHNRIVVAGNHELEPNREGGGVGVEELLTIFLGTLTRDL